MTPWVRRGCEVEAQGVSAAWSQGRETVWETEGQGGWGEREDTGAVCAGCGKGGGLAGEPALAPDEETAERWKTEPEESVRGETFGLSETVKLFSASFSAVIPVKGA